MADRGPLDALNESNALPHRNMQFQKRDIVIVHS
jgi:hypothetical protein